MSDAVKQETNFIPVSDISTLRDLLTRSHEGPVVLFKHSTTCPISAAAYRQMSQLARDVALIVVQRVRDVSRDVEVQTGVKHESPQTIILRNGQAVWSASHFDITADAVKRAIREQK